MRVKRFLARTLPEAVAMVKAELGPGAVILTTKNVKIGGMLGLFGHKRVEVMAAVDEEAPTVQVQTPPPPVTRPLPPAYQPAQAVAATPGSRPAMVGAQVTGVEQVHVEMAAMRQMLQEIGDRVGGAPGPSMQPELTDIGARLGQVGVEEPAVQHLLGRVQAHIVRDGGDWSRAGAMAREYMVKDLGATPPIPAEGRQVIALVGPTGVGKTTTLAKLAAHFTLGQGRKVSLITADTYRVSAVDQLRTYAEILGLPLEVVYDPSDMAAALGRQAHRDIVLVDTAGRSPRNAAHMGELQELLKVLKADQTHLVMTVTTAYRDAVSIVEQYLPMGFDKFLFTKWDESTMPGLVYSLVQRYRKPLSYITTGQNVPDDIEHADPHAVTRALLGDSSYA